MTDSYYGEDELRSIGFRCVGRDVRVSRKASIYNPGAISLGDRVRIDDFCVLSGGSGIELGSYVHIACNCALFAGSGIAIGDFSGLSARVMVYSESDDYSGHSLTNPTVPQRYKPGYQKAPVTVGMHVIVGASSTLLPGVHLDTGAAVGAHSLVTKNCEAWWIYFGVPARKLRRRSKDLLRLAEELTRNS